MTDINTQALDRELKRVTAELLILSLLDARPRHGYELSKLIHTRSGGETSFTSIPSIPCFTASRNVGGSRGHGLKSPYFFFDPIFAQPNSPGDLAKIVMLLGGGWVVRVPLILIGAAGTIYGYFWMGESAMHFSLGTTSTLDSKFRVGFILCVLPYLTNNLIFTFLAWFHPLGKSGFVATILKLWFGFLGFILAFMINFVWRAPSGPQTELTVIPQRLSRAWLVAAAVCAMSTFVLLRSLNIGRLITRKQ